MELARHLAASGQPAASIAPSVSGTARVMEVAYREFLSPRTMRTVLAALGATVAVFTVIGPVGTFEALSPLRRLGYWSLCYLLAWPVYFCMSAVTLYFLRRSSARTAAFGLAAMALAASVPATGVVCAIDQLLRPGHVTELPLLYARVAAVMVPVTGLLIFIVLERSGRYGVGGVSERRPFDSAAEIEPQFAPPAPQPAPRAAQFASAAPQPAPRDPQPAPRAVQPAAHGPVAAASPYSIFHRLPRRLGTDLIYLTVDDHYVEAHTRAGSAILLMRFADAVAELHDRGLQVHRSYWVAKRYMKRLLRREGRSVLRLLTGQEIPVSRTYLAAVRAVCHEIDLDAPAAPPRAPVNRMRTG